MIRKEKLSRVQNILIKVSKMSKIKVIVEREKLKSTVILIKTGDKKKGTEPTTKLPHDSVSLEEDYRRGTREDRRGCGGNSHFKPTTQGNIKQ